LACNANTKVSEPAAARRPVAVRFGLRKRGFKGAFEADGILPSEVVGLYVAVWERSRRKPASANGAYLASYSFDSSIHAGELTSSRKKQDGKKNPSWARWFILLGFAVVAFVAWRLRLCQKRRSSP